MNVQEDMQNHKIQVDCELPNSSLYTFTGNLVLDDKTIPLSPNQVLLRGCMLRNTSSVLGVVIFTGHETKVRLQLLLTLVCSTHQYCVHDKQACVAAFTHMLHALSSSACLSKRRARHDCLEGFFDCLHIHK